MIACSLSFLFIWSKEGKLINQIQINYSMGQPISDDLEEELIQKKNSPFLTRSEQAFISGYLKLNQEGNLEGAQEDFELAVRYRTKYGRDVAVIYSYKILADLMLSQNNLDGALSYTKDALEEIPPRKYNRYYEVIWDFLKPYITTEKGRSFSIQVLEQILEDRGMLDVKQDLFFTRILAVLYALDQDYSYSIQANLQAITLSEQLGDYYIRAESLVDIGITLRQVGGYEAADKILTFIDANLIEDDYLRANLDVYKLINLAEIKLILQKYDEAIDLLNQIRKYEEVLNEEYFNEINSLSALIMAQTSINQQDLIQAEGYLSLVENYLEEEETPIYVDKEILYHIVLGTLYKGKEQYEDAISSFNTALTLLDDISNNEYRMVCLNELIDIYKVLGNESNQAYYEQQLIDLDELMEKTISHEYLNYIEYMFNHNKIIQERLVMKTIGIVIITIFTGISVFLSKREIYPFLKKLINRKRVRRYLNHQMYFLVYQPVINPKKSQIIGVEALLRLKIKDKIIMPNKSIGQIEDCGMLGEVTIWILKSIISDYNQIRLTNKANNNFYISMNISLHDIQNDQFCSRLIGCLTSSTLPKNSICLEITENVRANDEEKIKQNLELLKTYGFLIALDDFGVEYSNLSILDKFDFDIIKLDKYFIDFINRSKVHQTIMEVADYLSINKKVSIIVEGVESEDQRDIVKNTTSDRIYIQGYFYSKPLEIHDLIQFVRTVEGGGHY